MRSLIVLLLVTGCSSKPDYAPYREAVKAELIDPESAQFRNEQVRTLWSQGGKRRTVYCAEVNANNRFGGKTGFQYVTHLISSKPADKWGKAGSTFVGPRLDLNYYMDCIRSDTERSDKTFAQLYVLEAGTREEMRKRSMQYEPQLSQDIAPELRH